MYSLSISRENGVDRNEEQTKEKALVRLMNAYGNDVLRISYMYLRDLQKAEDAFQEVFIRVFDKFGDFRGESSEKTWIIRITINVCRDILRSSWIRRVILTDRPKSQYEEQEIENKVIINDQNRLLFDAVLSLPPVFKDVIILYYYQGYDTSEISRILKVPEGTVRSRLYRARGLLKRKLERRIDLGE